MDFPVSVSHLSEGHWDKELSVALCSVLVIFPIEFILGHYVSTWSTMGVEGILVAGAGGIWVYYICSQKPEGDQHGCSAGFLLSLVYDPSLGNGTAHV